MEKWEENEIKKEYLNGYRKAKRREKRLLEQIQQLRLDKMFPCLQNDDMPHAHNQADLSDYVVRLDDLMAELENERLESVRQYEKIYRDINRIKNETEIEVLVRRYIKGEKWEKIALEIGYDYRYTLKIHGRALENFHISERGHQKTH